MENPRCSPERNKVEFILRGQHAQFSEQRRHHARHGAYSKNRGGGGSFHHQLWKFANLRMHGIRFGIAETEELLCIRGACEMAEFALVAIHDGGLACGRQNDGPGSRLEACRHFSGKDQRRSAGIGDFHHLQRQDGVGDRAAEIKRCFAQKKMTRRNVPCACGIGKVRKFTRVMTASVPSDPISNLCRS